LRIDKWLDTPINSFRSIQKLIKKYPQDDQINDLFTNLSTSVLEHLDSTNRMPLTSKVNGKEYFAFRNDIRHSRSVNKNLFIENDRVQHFLQAAKELDITSLNSEEVTKACYTIATGFACVVDLINPGDRQTPGCLFEYLTTHLLTRELSTDASERVRVKIGDDTVSLTMDLVLNLVGGPKYHVAIKTSTRERASEFWAQQRILDEAFKGEYIGYFFGMAETKLNHFNGEVVEICVPDQWRAYQYYLSTIKTIYYLDPPKAYLDLNNKSGGVSVKAFGDFFWESDGH